MNEYLKNENSLAPYMVFPRFLLDAGINETAMILYTFLLDRARLSLKSDKWTDESGHTFLYYPVKSLAETLHKSEMTVKTSLAALEKADLITADFVVWVNIFILLLSFIGFHFPDRNNPCILFLDISFYIHCF